MPPAPPVCCRPNQTARGAFLPVLGNGCPVADKLSTEDSYDPLTLLERRTPALDSWVLPLLSRPAGRRWRPAPEGLAFRTPNVNCPRGCAVPRHDSGTCKYAPLLSLEMLRHSPFEGARSLKATILLKSGRAAMGPRSILRSKSPVLPDSSACRSMRRRPDEPAPSPVSRAARFLGMSSKCSGGDL